MREIENWQAPAPMADLANSLSELYLLTARRKEDSLDRKSVVALYAQQLRAFPKDIALEAVRTWPGKFFPTFAELRDLITGDKRTRERRLRKEALQKFIENGGYPEPKPISPKERETITTGFQKLKAELSA